MVGKLIRIPALLDCRSRLSLKFLPILLRTSSIPLRHKDPATIVKKITIDGFIASISKSVPTPIIPQLPEAIHEK